MEITRGVGQGPWFDLVWCPPADPGAVQALPTPGPWGHDGLCPAEGNFSLLETFHHFPAYFLPFLVPLPSPAQVSWGRFQYFLFQCWFIVCKMSLSSGQGIQASGGEICLLFLAQFWQDFFLMSKTILILLSQCRILKIKRIFTRKLLMQEEQQMRGRGCVVITGDNWFILGSVRQDPIEGVPFPPCQSSSVTQRNLL